MSEYGLDFSLDINNKESFKKLSPDVSAVLNILNAVLTNPEKSYTNYPFLLGIEYIQGESEDSEDLLKFKNSAINKLNTLLPNLTITNFNFKFEKKNIYITIGFKYSNIITIDDINKALNFDIFNNNINNNEVILVNFKINNSSSDNIYIEYNEI